MDLGISQPAATDEQPIFVIGAQRSGTTLLRLMLSAHSQVCIPPESLFLIDLEAKYGNVEDLHNDLEGFLDALYANVKYQEWNVERNTLKKNLHSSCPLSYPAAVSIVYRTYLQQFDSNARIWGDKNPAYLFHVDTILKHFPRAHLVHLIRDVRAVYNSIKSLTSRRIWKDSRNRLLLVTRRLAQSAKLVDEYQEADRFTNIYYEQLVSNPEKELERLCVRIGLDFDVAMLDFYRQNTQGLLVPRHRLAWHQRTLQPISNKRVDAWKEGLDVGEIEAVELLNCKNMQRFGYRCMTTPPRYRGWLRFVSESLRSGWLGGKRMLARLVKGRLPRGRGKI